MSPIIDSSLDEQPAKTPILETPFKPRRPLVGRAAPLLGPCRRPRRRVLRHGPPTLPEGWPLVGDRVARRLVIIPAVCAARAVRAAALGPAGLSRPWAPSRSASSWFALLCGLSGLHVLANFGKLGADDVSAAWAFLWFFEELSWVVLVAFDHPVGGRLLGLARADEGDRQPTTASRLLGLLVHVPSARRGIPTSGPARPLLLRACSWQATTRFGAGG